MTLQGFARMMVKQATISETIEKGVHHFFSKPLKAKHWGSQAEQAKKVIDKVGPKLDNKTHDLLRYTAEGGKHPSVNAKKIINETSKTHNLREFSATKPALAAGTAIGVGMGMRGSKKQNQGNMRMVDRSPQLTQDPSRVLY